MNKPKSLIDWQYQIESDCLIIDFLMHTKYYSVTSYGTFLYSNMTYAVYECKTRYNCKAASGMQNSCKKKLHHKEHAKMYMT